jgi:hypothetical protein
VVRLLEDSGSQNIQRRPQLLFHRDVSSLGDELHAAVPTEENSAAHPQSIGARFLELFRNCFISIDPGFCAKLGCVKVRSTQLNQFNQVGNESASKSDRPIHELAVTSQ